MALNSVFSWIVKKRIHQIELFIKYPHDVQQDVFRRLIQEARYTEWGKNYDYKTINGFEDFVKRVPLQTYEELKSYVDRLKKGEQNLLWGTEINWFAKSSGTTSDKSKFIPVSREALENCHYKGGKDLLALYINNYPESQVYSGKSLVMGGSSQINQLRDDSYFGDLSAIIIENLPFWVEFKRTPDKSIALMENWEEKIEKMAYRTMEEDVTNIAGVPSWTLVLLKRILEISGKKTIREVWPNLELFMHGGVSFIPYKSQFQKLIPDSAMHYVETYNASEGFFGIQDQKEGEELLLMLDYGIFYEFIPMDDWDSEQPKTLQLHEVELGKNYEMVISTNAGLWRYRIGDTVMFTSLNPYRIQVSGRTKHFINAFGEELIIDNAEKALKIACERTNSSIRDYTAGPVYMTEKTQGGHEWLIEFEKEPEELLFFTEVLDNALKSLNSDYEAKRSNDLTLNMPKVHSIKKNTFYNWLKSRGKLGGQNKVPRLANDRKNLDEILNFIRTN
jgi:hypothetical protein